MKFGKLALVASAAGLAMAPIGAHAAERAAAPVAGESEIGGGTSILVLLAIVGLAIGLVSGDDDPVSP